MDPRLEYGDFILRTLIDYTFFVLLVNTIFVYKIFNTYLNLLYNTMALQILRLDYDRN